MILKAEPLSFASLFETGTRFGLTMLTMLVFTLILHPLPNWMTVLLRRKYILQESDDLDQDDDGDDLGDAANAAGGANGPSSPTSRKSMESGHRKNPSSLSASFTSSMSKDPSHN